MSEELMGAVTARRARELVPLYDARVAFSDGDPGDVHEIARLEKIERHFASRLVAGPFPLRSTRNSFSLAMGGTSAFLKWPARGLLTRETFVISSNPTCTAL